MAAPTIRIDLLIFIRERGLKGATMQIQFNNISGGESLLWQVGKEELVDDACTCDANGALLFACGMGCHNHATPHAFGPHRHLRTIVETAHHLAFWTLLDLIWWEMQTRLNQRMIEGTVLFASGHESKPGQVSEHGSGPILAVEAQQGTPLRKLVRCEIPTNGREPLTQFLPVPPVAFVPKTAEPLEAVSLADDGPCPHHLPPLAAPVAWRTDLIQP